MGTRKDYPSATRSADIDGALKFAGIFLDRARAVEMQAALDTKNWRAMGGSAESSPMRDAAVADNFLVELFGFTGAVRAARDYICAAVARSRAEQDVRDIRLATDSVLLHKELGNSLLHHNIIEPARILFVGGENDGLFRYSYRESEIRDREARSAYNRIQAENKNRTGFLLGITELGEMAFNQLAVLHDECSKKGWYRLV